MLTPVGVAGCRGTDNSCATCPARAGTHVSGDGASASLGVLAYVKRTTVKLPDDLDARLRHEAERRGTTIADVSREALEAYLGNPSGRRRLSAAGAGHSGRRDVSERIEEILAAEVGR